MSTSVRNEKEIASLEPIFQVIVYRILSDYKGELLITDGYRSFAHQLQLYNDPKVFAAAAGYSFHNYGMAIDVVPFKNGQPDYSDSEAYAEIGRIAKRNGCEWGGDWKAQDKPHIQYTQGLTINQVRIGLKLKTSLVPPSNPSWLSNILGLEQNIVRTRKALSRAKGARWRMLQRKLERLLAKVE